MRQTEETCLITGEFLEEGEHVFYIESEGGYISGSDEKTLIDYLQGQGWSLEEIEESRQEDEYGEADIYFTTYEGN